MFLSVREFLKTFHIDCIFAEKRVQYMVYFLFGSTPGAAVRKSIEEFFCKSVFPLHQILHRSRRHCYRHFQSLSVLYFCCYFPAEQLLFPHRYLSVSFLSGTCFLKQPQSFLPVRRMNFSLFSLKKIRKKQKLSLTICSCIITRIRMFCLIRPRISITNYSVLWIMLHVS